MTVPADPTPRTAQRTSLRIEDYGIIGDTHTAALVGRDGSIDWLCLPRFDSPACFAKLLGDERNGFWHIAPTASANVRVRRWYRQDTLVLETEFETPGGVARLVDCMPVREVHPRVMRTVECIKGRIDMRMELVIRFDYGSVVPWPRCAEPLGLCSGAWRGHGYPG
jgi:GH15 family glucan-1,4-alpha-glucosidase